GLQRAAPRVSGACVMRRHLAVAAALVAFAACPKSQPPIDVLTPQQKLLSDLAVFTSGKPLGKDELAKVAKKPVDKYIDDLLAKPLGRLAKDVVMGGATGVKDRHPVPSAMILRSFKEGADKIYYLRGV